MTKRVALASAVLAVALAVATAGSTVALRLISNGTFGPGGRPLSEADVRRSFARTPAAPATNPGPSGTATPGRSHTPAPHRSGTRGSPPAVHSNVFSASGGTVFASCTAGQVTVTRWIPASGYSTDGYVQGPAASAWVKFKSDGSEQVMTVTCVDGRPSLVTAADDRGGGGGADGGHGGSSGR